MRSLVLGWAQIRLSVLVVLTACAGGSAQRQADVGRAPDPQSAGMAPPPRDDGRLPPTAFPRHYGIALRIDPTQPRFSGVVTILVDLPQSTASVVLNARDIEVRRAVATTGRGAIAATASKRPTHGGSTIDELVLAFAQPLHAGSATIAIDYEAPFAADLAGLYRLQENGLSYAYTQFEATDARRAFPCFDEPGFKTPYDVVITSPRGFKVLSNTPEVSQADAGDGDLTHTFETSPPLPTYLVAFAVGDFDIVGGQTVPFPIRVVTTKGRAPLARSALDVATQLIAKLGDYFDMRYPYAKLDLVAVPDFAAGAMENPGLVTFRDSLLLIDSERATTSLRRAQAMVIAHEFAHQWFGDLVTMSWWDDLWLNEGFATWAAARIVDEWRPSFRATVEQIAEIQGVMDTDALKSARAVREPVRSTGEAMEAFDGITYDKGAAVLRMLEKWLGPDTFRRGVQRYVHEGAWKIARADDLFRALEYVSAQRVTELASGFLDQPGVPEVTANWSCGGPSGNRLELRQSEWFPLGEPRESSPRKWTLPVCIASDAMKTKSCFTIGAEPIVRTLDSRCPTWVYPNADQAGYYRFLVDSVHLLALAGAGRSLDAIDRLGLVSNAWAGVRQGNIAPGLLLDVLAAFDGDTDRHVIEQVVGVLSGVDHALISDDARPAFERYASTRLAARKRMLGWEPAKGVNEDDDRKLLRRSVLGAMGGIARDAATLREAETYAVRWLQDPNSLSGDIAALAVPLASMQAGAARLTELRAAARSAKTPQDRIIALRAMGTFEEGAVLRQALDLALTDELKLSELHYVLGEAASRRLTRDIFYAWEKENWQKLVVRLPGALARGLPGVVANMCTQSMRDDAREFFTQAMQGIPGSKRLLDEALEQAGLCIALREHDAARTSSWLSAHAR
jgi:aminopeptidase N